MEADYSSLMTMFSKKSRLKDVLIPPKISTSEALKSNNKKQNKSEVNLNRLAVVPN